MLAHTSPTARPPVLLEHADGRQINNIDISVALKPFPLALPPNPARRPLPAAGNRPSRRWGRAAQGSASGAWATTHAGRRLGRRPQGDSVRARSL